MSGARDRFAGGAWRVRVEQTQTQCEEATQRGTRCTKRGRCAARGQCRGIFGDDCGRLHRAKAKRRKRA